MRRTLTGTLLLTAAAGSAVALSAGAGTASAAVKEGTYQLCLERQYGSSVEQKCTTYRVEGDKLIGPANQPLTITPTATGGRAEISPTTWVVLTEKDYGYEVTNVILGIPTATSTLKPIAETTN